MLIFTQGSDQSKTSSGKNRKNDVMFLSTLHVRVSTVCLLLSFWLIWCIAVVILILTYDVWSLESCWTWMECSTLSLLILFLGLMLSLGTYGYVRNSPTLCATLLLPPLSCAGAISGIAINYWISTGNWDLGYCLTSPTTPGFLCVWLFAGYAVVVLAKYCGYLKKLQISKRRAGFNVDVFKERLFGTPPLKQFKPMEVARCAELSESHVEDIIDDIFGEYEPNVALV